MKVLYLGHYRESTGWSQAAIDYILAMDSVGIDIVCRNITLTKWDEDIPERIKELEQKDTQGCTICIQHLLPHHLVGTDIFDKNISLFVSESASIKPIRWFIQLQQMDEVWVPNTEMIDSFERDQLGTPVKLVPHTFDLKKYGQQQSDMSIKGLDFRFKFYYVGDLNDRKNVISIIKSFYSEFDKSDPAALILKVSRFGESPQSIEDGVYKVCDSIKSRLRMYQNLEDYPPVVVIPRRLSDNELTSLHQYADCFVCPTHGEGWSIPSFDAMCHGNTPICSNAGGPRDFINPANTSTGTLVDGHYSVCDCSDAAFPDTFTGREEWFTPSESKIKQAMRYYYENRDKVDRTAGIKRGEEFSYENIGNQIKENLGA